MVTKIDHQWLCESLAHNRDSVFINVTLGSVYQRRFDKIGSGCPPRADVVSIHPSYNKFCITIYEIKENRADFQSDIRSDKWKKYLPFCNRFYFAVKEGVTQKGEIPSGVGLIMYREDEKRWSFKKSAKRRELTQDEQFIYMLQSLIFHRQTSRSMLISEDKRWNRSMRSEDSMAMS